MESNREERTVQEISLNNPIILTEILKQNRVPLKNCRLVSHFWNDIVLSLPNTRLALKLNRGDGGGEDCDEPVKFFDLCFALDGRVAKQISARSPAPYALAFAYKLMHLCEKFGDYMQILKISVQDESCVKSVYQVLKNCFPNLKQLKIRCKLIRTKNPDLEGILPPKPNLTKFTLTTELVTPFLSRFVQLVVNASPNLRGVALSWGFFPDFANSKCLDSLTIVLNDVYPSEIIRAESKLAELNRLLGQVSDQLVSLTFAYIGWNVIDTLPPNGFQLPVRKLPKLQNFRNDWIEVFQCDDLFKNFGMLPTLQTLNLAPALDKSTRVDEFWRNICNSKKTSGSVKSLTLRDVYDSSVVDGLTKVFPALERLRVDTFYSTIADGEVNRMEFGLVLKACGGWKRLKHLDLALPTYPEQVVDFIRVLLLHGGELFKRLRTLEMTAFEEDVRTHELTEVEMDLFKEMLLVMDGMEKVTMLNIDFRSKSVASVLTFMVSSNLDVGKFRLQHGSPYRLSK